MGTFSRFRVLFVLAMLLAGWVGGSQAAAAQEDGDAFPLTAFTAICPEEYAGPFDGCTPWTGVTVTFTQAGSDFAAMCVTSGTERAASCGVDVGFGTTITASIDPASIPAGYTLVSEPTQTLTIPDSDPEGVFGGPTFVLLAQDDAEEPVTSVSLPIYASLCADGFAPHDDCIPWENAPVSVYAEDGTLLGECTTATFIEYAAGCEIAVERGTTVIVDISIESLPAEYTAWTIEQVYDVPAEGDVEGVMFIAIPTETEEDFTALPVYASICSDALPPNDDCQPWEGVTIVAVTNDDAEYADACVTETFFETVAGCEIMMPRGANVTASISEDQIPEGYELFVEVPTWDMPAEGELESGPYFYLVPIEGEEPDPVPSPTPTTPVTGLPSTGSGMGDRGLATSILLGGVSALLVAGAGYTSTLRRR